MSEYMPMYDSYEPDRRATRYVPTQRMNIGASVYLPASEVDMETGRLKPERQRRCRTQAKELERKQLADEILTLRTSLVKEERKGGVRVPMGAAIIFVAVVMFVCFGSIMLKQSEIAKNQTTLNRLEREIAETKRVNSDLEAQIAQASDRATICYAAARDLGMIPAESAEAIHLTAVDTRPRQTAAAQKETPTIDSQTVTASGY